MCCSNVKPAINNFQIYRPLCSQVSVIEDESGSDEDMGDVDGADGGEGGEDEEPDEYVHVNEKFYYLEYIIRALGITHALVSLCMVIAYYNLKVKNHRNIFSREGTFADYTKPQNEAKLNYRGTSILEFTKPV